MFPFIYNTIYIYIYIYIYYVSRLIPYLVRYIVYGIPLFCSEFFSLKLLTLSGNVFIMTRIYIYNTWMENSSL